MGNTPSVDRYEPRVAPQEFSNGYEAEMVVDANGEWVSEDDYLNICVDLKDLQAKYDALVDKIGDIYRWA